MAYSRELTDLSNDLQFLINLLQAAQGEVKMAKRYEGLKEARPGGPTIVEHVDKGLEQVSLTLQKVEDYIKRDDILDGLRVKDQTYRWRIHPRHEAIHAIEIDHTDTDGPDGTYDGVILITYDPNIFNFQVGGGLISAGDVLRIVNPANSANAGVVRIIGSTYTSPTVRLRVRDDDENWYTGSDYLLANRESLQKGLPLLTSLEEEPSSDRIRLDWWGSSL